MQTPFGSWTCALTAAALALVPIGATGASPADPGAAAPEPGAPESFLVRIGEPATARAVRLALAGAFERLADRRCAAVLDDFRDGSGAPLSSRLAPIAPTPQAALTHLFFYDGSDTPACRGRQAWASTEPGSRVIRVCAGLDFIERARRKPERTEIWMIHEMLHTLGLEENPPSSEEITRRVAGRCLDLD